MKDRLKKLTALFLAAMCIINTTTVSAMAETDDYYQSADIIEQSDLPDDVEISDESLSDDSEKTDAADIYADTEKSATGNQNANDTDSLFIHNEEDIEEQSSAEEANPENSAAEEVDNAEAYLLDDADTFNLNGKYGITVAGTAVTVDNKDDVLGDKTVTYNPAENKLTLNNAVLAGGIVIDTSEDVTIELKGNNKIIKEKDGVKASTSWIYAKDALTISGGGTLTIDQSTRRFINSRKDLTLDGITLNFTMAEEQDDLRGILTTGILTITNLATVNINMNENEIAMISGQYIDIQNSTVNMEGDMEASGTAVYIDQSDIYVHAATEAISARKELHISDSRVTTISEPDTSYWDVYPLLSLGSVIIEDSVVKAHGCNGSILAQHIYTESEADIAKDDSKEIKNPVTVIDSWLDCSDEINGELTVEDSVLFIDNDGTVTGDAYVPFDTEVAQNQKLTVTSPARLTVPYDVKLTNHGKIESYCTGVRGEIAGTAPDYTHTFQTVWKKDDTAHWKECSRCGEKTEVTAHTYGTWKIDKYPGNGTTGLQSRSCTACGLVQEENLAALQVMTLKASGAKKAISLKWSKVSGADGYLIYGAKCSNKIQLIKTVGRDTTSYKQKKLKNGTYYRYYVTAYKNIDGKKVTLGKSVSVHAATTGKGYGYARKITVKKSSFTIKKGKSTTIRASVINTNNKIKKHTAQIRYISTNPNVATVTSRGKVIAKSKGSCYIYCYAMNGLTKKVKVRVN